MAGYGAYIKSGQGVLEGVPPPVFAPRDPVTGVDKSSVEGWSYPPLQQWVNTSTGKVFGFINATWVVDASSTGDVTQLTGDSGTATPLAGSIAISGTANQVLTTAAANAVTLSLIGPYTPATYTAHGILIGEGTSSIVAAAVGTDGQVMTGNSAADPAFAAIGTKSGLTAHGMLLAEGAGAFVATAVGTDGQVMTGNSAADPAFAAIGTKSALTAHGVLLAEGASAFVATAVGATGQVLAGVTGADPAWVNLPAFNVVDVTGSSQAMAVNTKYISDAASGVVAFTLPTTATLGQTITVLGNGPGGWSIAQNASQVIKQNASTTTAGTGGSLSSTNRYNCVVLQCNVTNTGWVISDASGNFTFV